MYGSEGAENLTTDGGERTPPTTADDLFPDGAQLDQLNARQIAQVLTNADLPRQNPSVPALTPIDASFLALLLTTIGLFGSWRLTASRARP